MPAPGNAGFPGNRDYVTGMKTIWIVAGESSGDLYGAHLAAELKRQRPDVTVRGMGSNAMRAAGVEILVDSSELGVVGFVEVLKHLRMFLRLFDRLVARAAAERPDAVVLIDYPGFNLRFAKQMRRRGIPVIYYISPQVWAWGKKRIPAIARDVTRMLVIFPFEPQVYAGTGLDVRFVGHPLKQILAARRDLALKRDPDTILLLPGSRNSELDRLLAPFTETAAWLKARNSRLKFVLAAPNERIAGIVEKKLAALNAERVEIEIVTGRTQEWMQRAACGLAASGTVTMECAMLGLPLVVAYRMNPVTVFLGRLLVKLRYFTIVNLVADRCIFQEFLQGDVCPKVLGPALEAILPGGARRAEVDSGMSEAVAKLGEHTDASALAAAAVLEVADGQAGRTPLPPRMGLFRRTTLALAVAAAAYTTSYIGYRATHTELDSATQIPCVVFPECSTVLYRLFRPLSLADQALTGTGTRLASHPLWHPGVVVVDAPLSSWQDGGIYMFDVMEYLGRSPIEHQRALMLLDGVGYGRGKKDFVYVLESGKVTVNGEVFDSKADAIAFIKREGITQLLDCSCRTNFDAPNKASTNFRIDGVDVQAFYWDKRSPP